MIEYIKYLTKHLINWRKGHHTFSPWSYDAFTQRQVWVIAARRKKYPERTLSIPVCHLTSIKPSHDHFNELMQTKEYKWAVKVQNPQIIIKV